jgi:hypothetical protein
MTPQSSSTGYTPEQRAQLFELEIRRKTREQEMAEEEHRAKMAALAGNVMAAGVADVQSTTGENSPKVLEISKRLSGIPRSLLSAILEGKFDPYNLYKLRTVHADEDTDLQQRVSFTDGGSIHIQKAKGKLKDYGTKRSIWEDGFLNYCKAVTSFFGSTTPDLPFRLFEFLHRVIKLEETHGWKDAVLPLALTHHHDMMPAGQCNIDLWEIPHRLVDTFCHPGTIKAHPNNTSNQPERKGKPAAPLLMARHVTTTTRASVNTRIAEEVTPVADAEATTQSPTVLSNRNDFM